MYHIDLSGFFIVLTKTTCNTEFDLSRMSKRDQPCLHHTHMQIIKEHVACKDIVLRYII